MSVLYVHVTVIAARRIDVYVPYAHVTVIAARRIDVYVLYVDVTVIAARRIDVYVLYLHVTVTSAAIKLLEASMSMCSMYTSQSLLQLQSC